MSNPDERILLCAIADIPDPGCRTFVLPEHRGGHEFFVVHNKAGVFAYLNQCPHTGAPMDWTPDQFLSLDLQYIQCAIHGAHFRIDDGYCVWGPCLGSSLTPLAVKVKSGQVYLSRHAENNTC